jgi:crotonobetainyl-CoA:carnitine CoA-transferase CaiB-like acyl-CoA transferase
MKALEDIKVLDLTRALAGPYCTLMLGDYGADVIKVEVPSKGDDTRTWGPPFIKGQSSYFLSVNRNKRSITLNLKNQAAKDIFMKLASETDVLVENFTPGVVQRLGIDYETLKELNPGIIYCSISGFGQTGPYNRKPAYDQMMQGIGGIMSVTGEPDGPPMKTGIAITDIGAGMLGAYAVMIGLFHRSRTGHGQYIDISMLDLQVAWLTYQAGTYFATGSSPQRVGAAHPNLVPYQAFQCSDGKYINIAIGNERFWERFCKALGRDDLITHEDYSLNMNRVNHREPLVSLLETELLNKSSSHWITKFEDAGIPCGPVNDLAAVFSDPQVSERKMVETIEHPTAGKIKQTGIPIKFSETPGLISLPPPLLGEHTEKILSDLGYSINQISEFRETNVI